MKNTLKTFFALISGLSIILLTPLSASAYSGDFYFSFSGLSEMSSINESDINFNKSFFVSPNGNDESGDGTNDKPFKTVNKAIKEAGMPIWDEDCNLIEKTPETIYLHEGSYAENIVVNKDNITIRNYPGETATVTGGGLTTINANVYIEPNRSNIKIYGLNIEDRQEQDIEGVYGVFIGGGASNIIVQNNKFKNLNANEAAQSGIHGYNATGVIVYGNQEKVAHSILIAGNEFSDMDCGRSEVITLNGYVAKVDVIENYIHDIRNIGIDIAGQYGVNSNPDKDYARYVNVAGNKIEGAASGMAVNAGIYVDGAKNVLVERNEILNTPVGISVGEENDISDNRYFTEGVIVSSNLLVENKINGIRMGTAQRLNSAVINSMIVNNTIYHASTASSSALVIAKGHDNKVLNNVVYDNGSWHNIVLTDDNSTPNELYNVSIENNYFYSQAYITWLSDATYFNFAGTSYGYEAFDALDFTSGNILNTTIALDSEYGVVAGSDLAGAGKSYEYSDLLRDFNGNLRASDAIDLGYKAVNTRANTDGDLAKLTATFPFARDMLSNLEYGHTANPDEIVVPDGMSCPYSHESEGQGGTVPEVPETGTSVIESSRVIEDYPISTSLSVISVCGFIALLIRRRAKETE